ncbi:hypothetical protein B9Z43_01390 [Limnohabitans sp. MMS-10A-192]|uniref:hypothetical protein n=1 Tax=Limnohabitans sp. MMS-10A-192 TaxID=1835769 RepID=UPI000D3DABE7|nr:hypothetical protein [Limnohabitans sp. MMS-10A-192]PUE21862.1 hypothetical protein B9Z43_01390 [Limnohabitans sp. MMS-10A-192]
MSKTVFLKVSSAFLVGGQLAKAGEIVEVTGTEAKDLLARGKATVATVADAPVDQEQEQEQHQNEVQQPEGEAVADAPVEAEAAAEAPAAAEEKPAGKGKKGK